MSYEIVTKHREDGTWLFVICNGGIIGMYRDMVELRKDLGEELTLPQAA
jgi:hypothetical protein